MIIMATSQWIAPVKSHLHAHQQDIGTTTLVDVIDQYLRVIITPGITTMTIKIGTGSADLNLTPIILGIGVTAAVTLTEVTLDLSTDPHAAVHHATEAQAHTITTKTHHTTDLHHTGVSPEIIVGPEHTHPTDTTTKPHEDHLLVQIKHPGSHRTEKTSTSPLMTHLQSTIALMNRTVIQRMI